MTTLAILREARALIDMPEKWCQDASRRGDAYCATGAISAACGFAMNDYSVESTDAYLAMFAATRTPIEFGLGDWNDDPERTHAEVLAAFDAAIAGEEAKA